MTFTLIVCTYQRPGPLVALLDSIASQSLYPDEVIVVDASLDYASQNAVLARGFKNLKYYFVDEEHRGLTRQRNFGISQVGEAIDVVCFFDDDIIPKADYFEILMATYRDFPDALGVGGAITDEVEWKQTGKQSANKQYFSYDGWERKDTARNIIRKRIGLDTNRAPGIFPDFAHGRNAGYLPPTGKVYEVDQIMGGVSSFRKSVFQTVNFSTYFEGYGLYEDSEFCVRLARHGKIYYNSAAQVAHYHAASGRPNQFDYGKMVVRNGWFVWRVKNPTPKFKDRFKWHLITLLLAGIRLANTVTEPNKKQAITEAAGRLFGWASLFINHPTQKKSDESK